MVRRLEAPHVEKPQPDDLPRTSIPLALSRKLRRRLHRGTRALLSNFRQPAVRYTLSSRTTGRHPQATALF